MEYKGYTAHVIFDDRTGFFFGKVDNSPDLITFKGRSVRGLRTAFHAAVDKYLQEKEAAIKKKKGDKYRYPLVIPLPLYKETMEDIRKNNRGSFNSWLIEAMRSRLNLEPKLIEENNGASIGVQKKKDVRFTLVIPYDLCRQVDQDCLSGSVKISRRRWILDAIAAQMAKKSSTFKDVA